MKDFIERLDKFLSALNNSDSTSVIEFDDTDQTDIAEEYRYLIGRSEELFIFNASQPNFTNINCLHKLSKHKVKCIEDDPEGIWLSAGLYTDRGILIYC